MSRVMAMGVRNNAAMSKVKARSKGENCGMESSESKSKEGRKTHKRKPSDSVNILNPSKS